MSADIITVENLGKKYIIGHQRQEKYLTLRDVVTNNVKTALHKTKELFSGKFITEGDEEEEFWALKDINFQIKEGERVGIIGRNGAGKSTLLKILSRITEPTNGKVKIRGRVASLLEVGTGFHPELSGRENIFLNGAILGMTRAEIRSKFDEIVQFAEVERFLDTPVKRYSSGMYVRLAFAVAAHLEPEILIVDEVLAVGDAQFQKKCLGKMEDVSKNEGRSVLFVSHNMGVIAQLCSKAILLQKGKLIEVNDTKKIIDRYLTQNNSSNIYEALSDDASKPIYFKRIQVKNNSGLLSDNFQFDENVNLDIEFVINEYNPAIKFSCTLQNTNSDYLSTIVEDVKDLTTTVQNGTVQLTMRLAAGVIAPNSYAFRFAFFIPKGDVYDLLEMVCPIHIHDTGTKLSLFEGLNYGSFFLNYKILGKND